MATRILLVLLLFCPAAHAEVKRFLVGNAEDVAPRLHGPAFHFQGGGTDVDSAFQWMFDQVRGCADCDAKLDVVVLTAYEDDDGYNDYLLAMKGVDSVETLCITSRADAELPEIADTIRKAEVVFFTGGDQCEYITFMKGTPVETAVESVYARGGGIGGTSAGDAIQGEFIYDACTGSAQSNETLANAYHESMTFTADFFHWKYMEGTITDQHLVERNRIGRTFVFLARQIQDGKTDHVLGIAANRETSLLIDKDGLATISGKGPAYFILADHKPELCKANQPLTFSNFKLWKVDAGGTFNLKNRPTTGYYLRSVKNGIIEGDPYAPESCVPYSDLLAAYGKKDPAAVKQQLEIIFRKCPYDFEPYRYLDATQDVEFIRRKAADLRRYLGYSSGDRLQYYATLWPLEWKITPPEDQDKLRTEIAEDVKELRNAGRDAMSSPVQNLRKIETKDGIETMEMVEIGDTRQWISMRGRHSANPVILVVHSPGRPLMPLSWAFQNSWEENFTVVEWDQRGAGKNATYADFKKLEKTLTLETLVKDTEQMVAYLKARLHKDKILLMSFSSGAQLAAPVAHQHPDWFYAYVEVGGSPDDRFDELAELAPEYYTEDFESGKGAVKWFSEIMKNQEHSTERLNFTIPVIVVCTRGESPPKIQSPKTKIVRFEDSTHIPMLEEPAHFLLMLINDLLPLTK